MVMENMGRNNQNADRGCLRPVSPSLKTKKPIPKDRLFYSPARVRTRDPVVNSNILLFCNSLSCKGLNHVPFYFGYIGATMPFAVLGSGHGFLSACYRVTE
jgi:hypothetical protein